MIIFLLTLLAVALAVILVGFILSTKSPHNPEYPEISYVGHNGRIERAGRVERARRYARASRAYGDYGYGTRQTRVVRASRELERRSGSHISALMDVRGLFSPHVRQTPWLGLALVLVVLCVSGVLVFRVLLPGSPVLVDTWPDAAASTPPPTSATTKPATFNGVIGVTKALERINQLDPQQYSSSQEFDTWAYSTCSAAAMTEIINAYNKYYGTGRQYRVTDILKVESGLREITPESGLLRSTGLDHTLAQFNFQVQWLNKPSVDDLVRVGNSGRPIIIDFPPDRWSGGHILVLRGGNSSSVFLADSSRLNMQVMARSTFLKYWAGFAAVVIPKGR
jgi:hypothetical protein